MICVCLESLGDAGELLVLMFVGRLVVQYGVG